MSQTDWFIYMLCFLLLRSYCTDLKTYHFTDFASHHMYRTTLTSVTPTLTASVQCLLDGKHVNFTLTINLSINLINPTS